MTVLPSNSLVAWRALTIAGSLLPLGAWAMWLIAGPVGAAREHFWRTQRRWTGLAAAVALVAGVGWLVEIATRLLALPETPKAVPMQWQTVLTQTTFGHAWLLRAAALMLLVALVSTRRPPGPARGWTGLGAGAVAALSLSLASHAAASGHGWRLAADMVHVAAAGLWLGALPLLGRALSRQVFDRTAAFRTTKAFSRMGVVCVTALIFSGGINASALGWSAQWWRSDYGRLVLVKIVLLAAMLTLALYNRLRLTPRLAGVGAGPAARALRRSIAAELLLGALIMVVVGVLGATMLPSPG